MSVLLHKPAKYAGDCHRCGEPYAVGDNVVMSPPGANRRRWRVYHSCCEPGRVTNTRVRWATPIVNHYEWMTPAQRVIYREACSKGRVSI